MLRILFLLFVIVPLVELYVLIEVGASIGGLATIALCLLTAALGGLIIRWQGMQTLLQARQSIATMQQEKLAEHGMHGLLLVLAGALLFFPGLITDVLGFTLLIPKVRTWLMPKFKVRKQKNTTYFDQSAPYQTARYRNVEVMDAEVIDVKTVDENAHKH